MSRQAFSLLDDMSRADRFFRRLLRLFPADFRGDFGDDMAATFNDQRRDVLAQGGSMAALRLWWDTIRGIADDGAARASRSAARRRALRIAEPPAQPGVRRRRRARARRRDRRQHRRLQHRQRRADPGAPLRASRSSSSSSSRRCRARRSTSSTSRRPTSRSCATARAVVLRAWRPIRNATYELSGIAEPERLDAARASHRRSSACSACRRCSAAR